MSAPTHQFNIETPSIIKRIAKLIDQKGGKTYLVGGIVRDAVINKIHNTSFPLADYDVEVFGLDLIEVEKILKDNLPYFVSQEGKAFQVLKVRYLHGLNPIDISVPRLESSTGPAHTDFITSPDPHLQIKEAAQRRDLTINALYYDIQNSRISDPYGGYDDIVNKRIHIVDATRFKEDPLRVLRVMQFAARFGFKVSPETIATSKEIVDDHMMETLPLERVQQAFMDMLYNATKPSLGFVFLKDAGALSLYMPELEKLSNTLQTPAWHPEGDVFIHTMQAVNAAQDIATREGLSKFEKALLIVGALCHDLGKGVSTEYIEAKDIHIAHGHSKTGIPLAQNILKRINAPEHIQQRIPILIEKHLLLPVLYSNHQNGTDQARALYRLIQELQKHQLSIDMLLWVTEADTRARNETVEIYEPLTLSQVPFMQEVYAWVAKTRNEIENTGPSHEEIIDGTVLMRMVNKPRGIWINAMKKVLEDLVFDPEFRNHIPRPYILDEENMITEPLVKALFPFTEAYIEKKNISWQEVSTDEKYRLELLNQFLLHYKRQTSKVNSGC